MRLRSDLRLEVLGIPLQAGGLVTSEQGPYRQAINQFYIGVDAQAVQKQLRAKLDKRIAADSLELRDLEILEKKNPQSVRKLFTGIPELTAYQKDLTSGKGLENVQPEMRPYVDSLYHEFLRDTHQQERLRHRLDSLSRSAKTAGQLNATIPLRDSLQKLEDKVLQQTLAINELTNQVPAARKLSVLQKLPPDSLRHQKAQVSAKLEDAKALQQDPNLSRHSTQLEAMGLLTARDRKLSTIQKLQLGTTYPYYSALSFNGASVLGFDIELMPGKWHFQASAAHDQNASQAINLSSLNSLFGLRLPALYRRTLVAASAGIGAQEARHLHVNMLYGTEPKGQARDTLFSSNTPQRNYLVGVDFAHPIWGETLMLKGEANKSMTVQDVNHYLPPAQEVGAWMTELYRHNDSLAKDYAILLELVWKPDEKYQVTAGHRTIGPGYHSFGVPFLRNDLQSYKLEGKRRYERIHLETRVNLEQEKTNLRSLKPYSMYTTYAGAGLTWQPRKAPVLSADYRAALQRASKDATDTTLSSGSFHLFNLVLSHNYGKKTPQHITLQAGRQLRTAQQTFNNPESPSFPTISMYTATVIYRIQRNKLLFTTSGNLIWERNTRAQHNLTPQDFVLPPQRLYAIQASLASKHIHKLLIEAGGLVAHDQFLGTRLSPTLTLGTTLLKTLICQATLAYNQLTPNNRPVSHYWQANTSIGYTF
ncbi:MAG: hypothetical protein KF690_02085 [Bacteroidetes bacterium]|nr:hypothetical protein [Bacteroidota bacterium]